MSDGSADPGAPRRPPGAPRPFRPAGVGSAAGGFTAVVGDGVGVAAGGPATDAVGATVGSVGSGDVKTGVVGLGDGADATVVDDSDFGGVVAAAGVGVDGTRFAATGVLVNGGGVAPFPLPPSQNPAARIPMPTIAPMTMVAGRMPVDAALAGADPLVVEGAVAPAPVYGPDKLASVVALAGIGGRLATRAVSVPDRRFSRSRSARISAAL